MKIDFTEIFSNYFEKLTALLPNVITAIIIMLVTSLIARILYRIISKATQKKWQDNLMSNFVARVIKWAIYLFGLVTALSVLGFNNVGSTIFAGAGVSAIVLGFAFKDIGENFLAGIILAIKRPFEIGDIIEIGGDKGVVKDLDIRLTHLRNSEGKDIYIPNSAIIKNTLTNYTKDGFLRINFMVGIAPEADIDQSRQLILDYLKSNSQILDQPEAAVVVQELGDSTVNLQVLFWVDILERKELPDTYLGHNIRSKVITDVKKILDLNGIQMPSPVIEHKMYGDSAFVVKTTD